MIKLRAFYNLKRNQVTLFKNSCPNCIVAYLGISLLVVRVIEDTATYRLILYLVLTAPTAIYKLKLMGHHSPRLLPAVWWLDKDDPCRRHPVERKTDPCLT
jgi:hypothetical protein